MYSAIIPLYSIMAWQNYYPNCQYHRQSDTKIDILRQYLNVRLALSTPQFIGHLFLLAPARFNTCLANIIINVIGCCNSQRGKVVWKYILLTLCNIAINIMTVFGWYVLLFTWSCTTLEYKLGEIFMLGALMVVFLARLTAIFYCSTDIIFRLAWS